MKKGILMMLALSLCGCARTPASPPQGSVDEGAEKAPAVDLDRSDDPIDAFAIACADAQVSEGEPFNVKQEQSEESGIAVYQIEFETEYGDYDYAISVDDGDIIDADYEVDEEWLDHLGGTPLDMNEAAAQVAAKIGADTEDIRIWQEEDDGRIRYEGEALHDGLKAEFEMDAKTGIIFDWNLGLTSENEDR